MRGMSVDCGPDHNLNWSEPLRRADRRRADKLERRDRLGAAFRWLAVLALCAVILGGLIMFLLGFRTYAITGGSMADAIGKGALAIDRIVPVSELEVGDIITYSPPGRSNLVTHRIISVDPQADGSRVFHTQGDANESADPWTFTLDSGRQARYVFQVPYLGYLLLTFGSPLMRMILLVGLALLLTFTLFLKLWREAGKLPESESEAPGGSACADGDTGVLAPADSTGLRPRRR
jgi:signal peptidase